MGFLFNALLARRVEERAGTHHTGKPLPEAEFYVTRHRPLGPRSFQASLKRELLDQVIRLGGHSTGLWRFNVAKAEWGQKRICPSCSSRYYDMKKNPPVCPSCGTVFDPEVLLRARRGRGADKKAVPAPAPEEIIEEIPAAAGEEGEDAVIEDAEELGEDGAVEDVVERDEEAV